MNPKLATVVYKGSLPEGTVQCPNTGVTYPRPVRELGKIVKPGSFKRGEAFKLPEELAANVAYQAPEDWEIPASVQALIDARKKDEKEAADFEAARAEKRDDARIEQLRADDPLNVEANEE